jgi:hypothetical protein
MMKKIREFLKKILGKNRSKKVDTRGSFRVEVKA